MLESSFLRGAAFILVSELFLVLSGMVIKQISNEIPTAELVFFRNLFAVILLLPWVLKKRLSVLKTSILHLHLMRAAVGVTAMSCLFYSWANLPLAQAALLKQTSPFFVPVIAFLWLKESISRLAKYAIIIGFFGVCAVLNPDAGVVNLAVFIAVFGAALGALAKVTIRRLSRTEGAKRIVFYFAFFSTLLSAVPAGIVWVQPTDVHLMWLVVLAATSTTAQLLLSKGYASAPAGQLAPFTYASVAFAAVLGWWLWQEQLGLNVLVGMVLIAVAGILAVRKPVEVKS